MGHGRGGPARRYWGDVLLRSLRSARPATGRGNTEPVRTTPAPLDTPVTAGEVPGEVSVATPSADVIAVWSLCPLRFPGEPSGGLSEGERDIQAGPGGRPAEPPLSTGLIDSTSESVERLRIRSLNLEGREDLGCRMVQRHVAADREFLSAVVLVPVDHSLGSVSEQRLSIEGECRERMDALVDSVHGSAAEIFWVNRTLLVPSVAAPELSSWVSAKAQTVQEGGLDRRGSPYVITSWGNNVINEVEFYDSFIGQKFREGMIDAQTVWLDLERIAEQAEDLVEAQIQGEEHVRVGDGQTEALLVSVAKHNLLFDEVLLRASAVRSAIATSVLDSWQYQLLRNRVDQRVRDADALAQRRRLRREARYESRVSNVLLILSIVSSVQLILAVVALAYSGSVQDFPGSRATSIVAWIRWIDADIWLLLTFLSAGLLYAFVAVRRRL